MKRRKIPAAEERSARLVMAVPITVSERPERETLLPLLDVAARPAAIERTSLAHGVSQFDMICTHDLDGRILSASPALCEVLDRSPAVLRGVSIRDLLLPGSASGFDGYLHSVLAHSFAAGTMKVVTSAGSRLWKYHAVLEVTEGEISIIRARATDVSDLEEAFRAIRESEEHFRSIIE